MFICEKCLDKYEGPAVHNARIIGFMIPSYGPCEVCHKVDECCDIPSSASFWLKKEKDGTN